jgi:hypothetical protein
MTKKKEDISKKTLLKWQNYKHGKDIDPTKQSIQRDSRKAQAN